MKKHHKYVLILEVFIFTVTISMIAKQGKFKLDYGPIKQDTVQDTELSKSITRGEVIYNDFCMQCHLADGKGVENTFPPLAGSDWLIEKRQESIHSIKHGLNGPIKVNRTDYNSAMTSQGLEDEEIADVMNYIMNNWGNTQEKMVTIEEVSQIKK